MVNKNTLGTKSGVAKKTAATKRTDIGVWPSLIQ